MTLDGVDGDAQAMGDLGVGFAGRDESQDVRLARGEAGGRCGPAAPFRTGRVDEAHPPRTSRWHRRRPGGARRTGWASSPGRRTSWALRQGAQPARSTPTPASGWSRSRWSTSVGAVTLPRRSRDVRRCARRPAWRRAVAGDVAVPERLCEESSVLPTRPAQPCMRGRLCEQVPVPIDEAEQRLRPMRRSWRPTSARNHRTGRGPRSRLRMPGGPRQRDGGRVIGAQDGEACRVRPHPPRRPGRAASRSSDRSETSRWDRPLPRPSYRIDPQCAVRADADASATIRDARARPSCCSAGRSAR